jgi:hypothetical protein
LFAIKPPFLASPPTSTSTTSPSSSSQAVLSPARGEAGEPIVISRLWVRGAPASPLYSRFLPFELSPPAGGSPGSKTSIHPEEVFQGGESMRKRIPKKTSSPWAPYLKMREGSPPSTRAMFMTWPAARSALSAPAVQNDLPGRLYPVDLRTFYNARDALPPPGGGERRYRALEVATAGTPGAPDPGGPRRRGRVGRIRTRSPHPFRRRKPLFCRLLGAESRPRAPASAADCNDSRLLN